MDKPVGAKNSYQFFLKSSRENKQKERPDFIFKKDFAEICSKKWKRMTDDEKKPFIDLAAEDKRRYRADFDNFVLKNVNINIKKKEKDPNKPKRGRSSYMLFSKDQIPNMKIKHPGLSGSDLAKIIGKMWGELKSQEKKKYDEEAENEMAKYYREMEAYQKAKNFKKRTKAEPAKRVNKKKQKDEEENNVEDADGEEEDDDNFVIFTMYETIQNEGAGVDNDDEDGDQVENDINEVPNDQLETITVEEPEPKEETENIANEENESANAELSVVKLNL